MIVSLYQQTKEIVTIKTDINMKTTDYTGLSAVNTTEVVKGLQQLLADYQVFYTNLRGFHWNVKGKRFFQLHEQFENYYNNVAEKVDEIAERILMLGEVPPHNFSDYLKVAHVKESDYVSEGKKAVQNVLETYTYLIAEERKLLSLADKAGDEVTVAMMSDYLREQEKQVWMLTAYLYKHEK